MAVTAFSDLWILYNDSTLQTRATMACVSAAAMTLLSAFNPITGVTANQRKNWARFALANPSQEGRKILWGIITNTALQTNGPTATDIHIFNAASAFVPLIASAYSTALLG